MEVIRKDTLDELIQEYKSDYINNIGLLNETYNIIQKPLLLSLSKDNVDFDASYLIDDGEYINIFIFDENKENFYLDLFGVENWQEAVQSQITNLSEENQTELNVRLTNIIDQLRKENGGMYQPVRIFFLDQNGIFKSDLASLLFEDKIGDEVNYPDFLCFIHNSIQDRIS
mgnify:CR=1 FL=1